MILDLLTEKGEVYVNELSRVFQVSEVTIRNDLLQLEQKNMLLRARGGAIRLDHHDNDRHISEKARQNYHQKARIGRAAAKLIHHQDTIIIGPGTTTAELARNIPENLELTVITNSIPVIQQLISKPNLNIIALGGNIRKNSGTLTGPIAELGLKNFYVDKVILGADGCDSRRGVFTSEVDTAQIMQLMISNSREVILVADSSKFNRKSLTLMCSFDRVDILVTDNGIDSLDRKHMEDRGVRVIIA